MCFIANFVFLLKRFFLFPLALQPSLRSSVGLNNKLVLVIIKNIVKYWVFSFYFDFIIIKKFKIIIYVYDNRYFNPKNNLKIFKPRLMLNAFLAFVTIT